MLELGESGESPGGEGAKGVKCCTGPILCKS